MEQTKTIEDVLGILNVQLILERTPKGRVITDFAKENIQATLDDKNNYDQPAMTCKNCGLIISSLLLENGCPNCGSLDFDSNIWFLSV